MYELKALVIQPPITCIVDIEPEVFKPKGTSGPITYPTLPVIPVTVPLAKLIDPETSGVPADRLLLRPALAGGAGTVKSKVLPLVY